LIEHGLTSPPTQYRGYTGDGVYRSEDPTNSIKTTEATLSGTSVRNVQRMISHDTLGQYLFAIFLPFTKSRAFTATLTTLRNLHM